MKPTFFATPEELREWFERHHGTERELWVGFHRKDSGKPSITWRESVDEALCFGWIDGVRKSVDETSYANRFTPRRPRSTWSAVNVARAEELIRLGRMRPAGLEAFARRTAERTGTYSHEQATIELDRDYERRLRANPRALAFFEAQPPWYRRAATWWVMSAKREETRSRRLARLIEDSEAGRTVPPLTRPTGRRRRG